MDHEIAVIRDVESGGAPHILVPHVLVQLRGQLWVNALQSIRILTHPLMFSRAPAWAECITHPPKRQRVAQAPANAVDAGGAGRGEYIWRTPKKS